MCPPAVVRVGAGASAGNRARGGTALPTLAGGYIYALVDPSGATASVYRCMCVGVSVGASILACVGAVTSTLAGRH